MRTRRSYRTLLALGASALLLGGASIAAAVPSAITYTGELRAENGLPYTGAVDVQVTLFDAAMNGSAQWTADLGEIMVMNGILQADLDDPALAPLLGAASGGLYVEFTIDGEVLQPRQQLVSVPYAAVAGRAMMLGDQPASSFVTTDALGGLLGADALPTDGINTVSNGALMNKFLDETRAADATGVSILDALPSNPPADAVKTLDTDEGPGSYVTSIAFRTVIGLDFNSHIEMWLAPPPSAGVAPIELRNEFLTAASYDEMWTVATTPALGALLGQQLAGEWTLIVRDTDNTAAGSPPIGTLTTFEVMYDVVRADHLVVNGRLDVTGDIEAGGSVTATTYYGDGSNLGGFVKIRNVTVHEDASRVVLPLTNSHAFASFSVDKKSPTSILVIEALLTGHNAYSGAISYGWRLGSGTETAAAGHTYPGGSSWQISAPTRAVITGHAQTGPQTLVGRYFTQNGSGSNRPFNILNPNSSDDGRLQQTKSIYVVWEIEP